MGKSIHQKVISECWQHKEKKVLVVGSQWIAGLFDFVFKKPHPHNVSRSLTQGEEILVPTHWFLEWEGWERQERNTDVRGDTSIGCLLQDQAYSSGTCPGPELNLPPFGLQADALTTEQPERARLWPLVFMFLGSTSSPQGSAHGTRILAAKRHGPFPCRLPDTGRVGKLSAASGILTQDGVVHACGMRAPEGLRGGTQADSCVLSTPSPPPPPRHL